MCSLTENTVDTLQKKNIKPSYARIKVYDYLKLKKNHPTVDEIFNELGKEIPTLSKTTVYNTLGLLIEAGLARIVTIEDNETRYDADVTNHGHFKCENCGEIYDFEVDIDGFVSKELAGFRVNEKNVYFKGSCSSCLGINKKQ